MISGRKRKNNKLKKIILKGIENSVEKIMRKRIKCKKK